MSRTTVKCLACNHIHWSNETHACPSPEYVVARDRLVEAACEYEERHGPLEGKEPERRTYFFEVYTKGPGGETGWEIHVGFVLDAENRKAAIDKLRAYFADRFDEVIQCYEAGEVFKIHTEHHYVR